MEGALYKEPFRSDNSGVIRHWTYFGYQARINIYALVLSGLATPPAGLCRPYTFKLLTGPDQEECIGAA